MFNEAVLKSKKGFYIGDPCYIMNDVYDFWLTQGKGHTEELFTMQDGMELQGQNISGLSFVVFSTTYGDGDYLAHYLSPDDATVINKKYLSVDAGVLAVIPLELQDKFEYDNIRDFAIIIEDLKEVKVSYDEDEPSFTVGGIKEDKSKVLIDVFLGAEDGEEYDEDEEDYFPDEDVDYTVEDEEFDEEDDEPDEEFNSDYDDADFTDED